MSMQQKDVCLQCREVFGVVQKILSNACKSFSKYFSICSITNATIKGVEACREGKKLSFYNITAGCVRKIIYVLWFSLTIFS